ncbi:hypothetical protein HF324_28490 [Chitinophaga oryzae]|uniref:Uncharacterized protein n=1 Tax=Chitinophaga oryzae TaxID=2725414 RepID=A0AAE7DAK3_9BACT|nr:hypothetical protein [Chitinophaga oryzae]QJB35055.1 hypothetical protein HF329_28615 [Chitinophaga oryzae]QJB41572.1 hypothetical protein HF324_28490 [Chitinophaga oryzae]
MSTDNLTNEQRPKELNKLPRATNAAIRTMFTDIDEVFIKEDGVYNDKAMSENVLLHLTQTADVSRLGQLLEIDEANTGFYCMCPGTYAIELHSRGKMRHIIGFHHEVSIRYSGWNGDAALSNNEALLAFLSELGFSRPWEDYMQARRNRQADQVAEENWFSTAPKTFRKYRDKMGGLETGYLPALIQDLDNEIPDRQQQIVALLRTYGQSDKFWSGYPSYESVPEDILKTFDIKNIIHAYLQSDRNYKTRAGLGRFLCSFDFKTIRKNFLKNIPPAVVADLENYFNHIKDQRGINEIFSLKKELEKIMS